MRIAVIDVSAALAAIIEEGLRDAGLHDITLLTERRVLPPRWKRWTPTWC